jgi:hypothetical protein
MPNAEKEKYVRKRSLFFYSIRKGKKKILTPF